MTFVVESNYTAAPGENISTVLQVFENVFEGLFLGAVRTYSKSKSSSEAFEHNATGPRSGRLDATAARRNRRRLLELVRPVPYMACARVLFENLQ